jgi:hypothetical protein
MTLTHHSRVRLKVGECVCSRKWSARECEHFNGEKSTCAKKKIFLNEKILISSTASVSVSVFITHRTFVDSLIVLKRVVGVT